MLFNNGDPACIIFHDLSHLRRTIAVVIGIRNTILCHAFERVSPEFFESGLTDIHVLFSQRTPSTTNVQNLAIETRARQEMSSARGPSKVDMDKKTYWHGVTIEFVHNHTPANHNFHGAYSGMFLDLGDLLLLSMATSKMEKKT
jgi:hypothetical protein